MMKRSCLLSLAVAVGMHINANGNQIMFTEVCVANIDQTIDYSYNYGGWVELYNPTATDISLNGWYISDDPRQLKKHRLSGCDVFRPRSYACLFFDHNAADGEYGPEASRQVRFKLNRTGGTIYLSKNGTDVDLSISYPESVPRCSYARVSLGTDDWQYCGMPTPGQPNAGHYAQERLLPPEVDCEKKK